MIISDQHRYVFVELPRTASSTIDRELRQHYAGRRILRKHSTYRDFLAVATPEQREYFVFSCIRNPLDEAVSRYYKYLTDHRRRYSRLEGRTRRGLVGLRDQLLRRWIARREPSFSTFFLRTYVLPYDNWASESHGEFDYVIRFERLADDFAEALRRLGVEPVRPLPVRNVTGGRSRDYRPYYSPRAVARAKRVFGPFMRRFGYAFPPEWGPATPTRWSEWSFRLLGVARSIYWRHLRFRI